MLKSKVFPVLFLAILLNSCTIFSAGKYSESVELSKERLFYWLCQPNEVEEWEWKLCSYQCIEVSFFDENSCSKGKQYEIDLRNINALHALRSREVIVIEKDILLPF